MQLFWCPLALTSNGLLLLNLKCRNKHIRTTQCTSKPYFYTFHILCDTPLCNMAGRLCCPACERAGMFFGSTRYPCSLHTLLVPTTATSLIVARLNGLFAAQQLFKRGTSLEHYIYQAKAFLGHVGTSSLSCNSVSFNAFTKY